MNDKTVFEKLLVNFKVDSKIFLEEILDQNIKDDLRKRTEDAQNKGIFGVPTFIVNNKMFWGQDRLEFVLNEIEK